MSLYLLEKTKQILHIILHICKKVICKKVVCKKVVCKKVICKKVICKTIQKSNVSCNYISKLVKKLNTSIYSIISFIFNKNDLIIDKNDFIIDINYNDYDYAYDADSEDNYD
jgi:hypothetical protein